MPADASGGLLSRLENCPEVCLRKAETYAHATHTIPYSYLYPVICKKTMTTRRTRTPILPLQALAGLFIAIAACAYTACSNSESVGNINGGESSPTENAFNVHETADSTTPASEAQQDQPPSITKYIPLDTEYPYAGIPRIVIETENRREIKDRETEIPAKLQIWGENTPESDIMKLTIRGRGNSSWFSMEKKSYKIEFTNKHEILGMPTNRDWALISNHADKTLMRNYLIYKIAPTVGAAYAPRCVQTELYLNGEYLGVYLLTETIKIGKNRVNIPDTEDSYIIEFDGKYRKDEQVFFSNIIYENQPFRIHFPHNASSDIIDRINEHIKYFESYLKNDFLSNEEQLKGWIDTNAYIIHYWLQELAKNPDGIFHTSVYFYGTIDEKIVMGPIWDFDVAFGNYLIDSRNPPTDWWIRSAYWNIYLFKSKFFKEMVTAFWKENSPLFATLLDSIEVQRQFLEKAAQNNFKRWNVLEKTASWAMPKAYHSYNEAVDSLKTWLEERIEWINSQIN